MLLVYQGVGEPATSMGSTVFFAIKKAVAAARAEAGLTGYYRMDMPASPERIRMACGDQFIQVSQLIY